jgi:hypothetical protein
MQRPPASLGLEFLDRRMRVETPDEEFFDGLERCFGGPRMSKAVPASGGGWDLSVRVAPPAFDLQRHEVTTSPDDALGAWPVFGPDDLCGALEHWAVTASERHYVFHAGAVAAGGRAIGLPGASGAGKSTLTAALIAGGLEYLSDEVCAVDRTSYEVDAHPRCLKLREDVVELLGLGPETGLRCRAGDARIVPPEELGAVRASDAPLLAAFVHPRFALGGPTVLTSLRAGDAVVRLMDSSCSQGRLKVDGLDWVIEAVGRVPSYELAYSRLDEAVARVGDLLA